jgi:acyl carrier protein
MSTQDVTPRIELVFSRVFGKRIPFSTDLTRLDESQWTSLKHVEFIIGLEEEFNVRFDGADATDMTSIPVVVERVRNRLS